MTTENTRLCVLSSDLDDQWRQVYETAFPANEREPETRIDQLVKAGRMLLHKTHDANGELLCFSLVSLAPDFDFLAYIATNPNQRSTGVGSKHMKKLIEDLKVNNPSSIGLFLEIEDTNPKQTTITDEERKLRNRRLGFYKRLGAKRLCRNFRFIAPGRGSSDEKVELDLLFINYTPATPLPNDKRRQVVQEIYERFYCLTADDELVKSVLAHFGPTEKCADDDEVQASTPVTGTSGDTPATPTAPPVDPAPVAAGEGTTVPSDKGEAAAPTDTQAPVTPESAPSSVGGASTDSKDLPAPAVSDCDALEALGVKPECDCGDTTSGAAPVTQSVCARSTDGDKS